MKSYYSYETVSNQTYIQCAKNEVGCEILIVNSAYILVIPSNIWVCRAFTWAKGGGGIL